MMGMMGGSGGSGNGGSGKGGSGSEPEPEPEPEAEPEKLNAPEFQILIPPYMLNLLNGMNKMTKHGISSCEKGLGQSQSGGCLQGFFDIQDSTFDDLNILLTGGRLSP